MQENIKCVVVGDTTVPISKLIHFYSYKEIDDNYIPAVADSLCFNLLCGDTRVELSLWNTCGQEEYPRLRPLTYAHAKVFLLTFNYDAPASIDGLRNSWCKEVKHYTPDAVYILTGISETTAENSQIAYDRIKLGRMLCKEFRLQAFVQCSLDNLESINQIFAVAVLGALAKHRQASIVKRAQELININNGSLHETTELQFINSAITVAKSCIIGKPSGAFSTLQIDAVKRILFFTAQYMGCLGNPRYLIDLIIENVRAATPAAAWNKSVVVNGVPRTIFCKRLLPFEKYMPEEEKKSGCTIS